MKISFIIPVYNSAQFIVNSLNSMLAYLSTQIYDYEIIVIDDGSTDQTYEIINSYAQNYPKIFLLRLNSNQGKFAAIAEGVKSASGECIIFTDADIPFDFSAFGKIIYHICHRGFHIVIGDRSLTGSIYTLRISRFRQLATWTFSHFVRLLVSGGLFDTQCGLKGFRVDVAKELFPLLINKGFAGDVELLYIALKYNFEIKRIPVQLRNSSKSTVKIWLHGVYMLKSICLLRIHWGLGYYRSEEMNQIARNSNEQSI